MQRVGVLRDVDAVVERSPHPKSPIGYRHRNAIWVERKHAAQGLNELLQPDALMEGERTA
jgi:hypothetical protein